MFMYCVPLVKKPESGSFLLSRMRSPLLAPLSLLLSAACSGLQLGSPLPRIPSPAMSASTTQTTTQTTAQTTAQTTVQSVPVTAQRNGWISQWMDHLKFDSKPSFDVLERTREYVATKTYDEAAPYYAEDYIFRGSIIGPITAQDVQETQEGFDIVGAYPDLERGIFGMSIDPNKPYRCFFFERWTGTHSGTSISARSSRSRRAAVASRLRCTSRPSHGTQRGRFSTSQSLPQSIASRATQREQAPSLGSSSAQASTPARRRSACQR